MKRKSKRHDMIDVQTGGNSSFSGDGLTLGRSGRKIIDMLEQ
jgi:hypothetical protein